MLELPARYKERFTIRSRRTSLNGFGIPRIAQRTAMAVSCHVLVSRANRRSLIMGFACPSLLRALLWTLHALYFLVRSSTLQDGMYSTV